ncbi:MAG: cell division protein FtsA [bacterium]
MLLRKSYPVLYPSPQSELQPDARPSNGKNQASSTAVGLDIGTTKICVIAGQFDVDSNLSVLGVGSTPNGGMRRGAVVDIDHTAEAIRRALELVQEQAHVPIREVTVGIAGDFITSIDAEAMIEIPNPNRGVTRHDIQRVINRARSRVERRDLEILHTAIKEFAVDRQDGIKNPLRLSGSQLEVHVHLVMCQQGPMNNIIKSVNQSGLRVGEIVLESMASALCLLTDEEKEEGVMLVDIGGGTTDVAVFCGGALHFTAEIPIGGDLITQDIVKILQIYNYDAENLKKHYGSADPSIVETGAMVDLTAPDNRGRVRRPQQLLAEVIEARVEQIFLKVNEKVEKSLSEDVPVHHCVLTGGTALMKGITSVAERILSVPVEVGTPRRIRGLSASLPNPIYATAIGLVMWGLTYSTQRKWYRRWLEGL